MSTRRRPARTTAEHYVGCTVKRLPPELRIEAAKTAVRENPANAPTMLAVQHLIALIPGVCSTDIRPEHIAALTTKYWNNGSVDLSVSFMDSPPQSVRTRILAHMNAWSDYGNVRFRETAGSGQVRITRSRGQGYYSYLGTDILHIPAGQNTMNLEAFSDSTPESEYKRVVRHETGHTLGFPHEHMRAEIVGRIDPQKAVSYFMRTQGWSAQEVEEQVLTPLSEASLKATPHADTVSIMCYALPGSIMRDGRPVPGGTDIDPDDAQFVAALYPKQVAPPPPPPPDGATIQVVGGKLVLPTALPDGTYTKQ